MPIWLSLQSIAIWLLVYIVLDCLWLWLISHRRYKERLKAIPWREENHELRVPRYGALPIRIIVVSGLFFLLHMTGIDTGSRREIATLGFLIGTMIYGIYNLTNYSLFRQRPLHLVLVDTLRWASVCMCVALAMIALV